MKLSFVPSKDRWGDPAYAATLTDPGGEVKTVVAQITKGWWEMPRRTRWEIDMVDGRATEYEDTLADAKATVSGYLFEIVSTALRSVVDEVVS